MNCNQASMICNTSMRIISYIIESSGGFPGFGFCDFPFTSWNQYYMDPMTLSFFLYSLCTDYGFFAFICRYSSAIISSSSWSASMSYTATIVLGLKLCMLAVIAFFHYLLDSGINPHQHAFWLWIILKKWCKNGEGQN